MYMYDLTYMYTDDSCLSSQVMGNNGMMTSGDKRPVDVLQYGLDGVHLEPIYDSLDRYIDSYRLEMEHFAAVVQGRPTSSQTITWRRLNTQLSWFSWCTRI